MKGRPILELLAVALIFGLLCIPMIRLTLGRAPAAATAAPAAPAHSVPAWAVLRFAHPPKAFRILVGRQLLWESKAGEALAERSLSLPLDGGQVDLLIEVEWPEATPETIVELTLEPDGLEARTHSAWGTGSWDGVLTFSWVR